MVAIQPFSLPGSLPLAPVVPLPVAAPKGTTIVMASKPAVLAAASKPVAATTVTAAASAASVYPPSPGPRQSTPANNSAKQGGNQGIPAAIYPSAFLVVLFAAVAKSLLDSEDHVAIDGVVYSKDDLTCAAMEADVDQFMTDMKLMASPPIKKAIKSKKPKKQPASIQVTIPPFNVSLSLMTTDQVAEFTKMFALPKLFTDKDQAVLAKILKPLTLSIESKSLLMDILAEREITINHLSGVMVLTNYLLSVIQSTLSKTSQFILPDTLRSEITFLYNYVRFCVESGQAHTLPYLFPNEYETSPNSSEITNVNVSTSVLLLRSIARLTARTAVWVLAARRSSVKAAEKPLSVEMARTKSLPAFSTNVYGIINTTPVAVRKGALAHKRVVGISQGPVFVGITPDLLMGDASVDVSRVVEEEVNLGDVSVVVSGDDSFVDVEWVKSVGSSTTSSILGTDNEGSEAGTVVGERVHQRQVLLGDDLALKKDGEGASLVSRETKEEDAEEWEMFRMRQIGIPEHILRLEFDARVMARAEGKDVDAKEDELDMW
ncbi:hypothetical protein HDU99_003852 [Rhizoclosmatium hyalinum]|nr:hypothetical protein HDU99_003852 [Rhizoclosmatium hyalinum]